jgi:cell division protein FtsB
VGRGQGIKEPVQALGEQEVSANWKVRRSSGIGMASRTKIRTRTGKKGLLPLIIFALLTLAFVKGAFTFVNLRVQRENLKSEIEKLKKDNLKLGAQISNVANDEEYVEKVAREQLNFVKEGETVFVFK